METRPALSTAEGHRIYVESEIRDFFSLLDVLYADQFEGDDPTFTEEGRKEEENFYRGAPPNWLNFHSNEREASRGTGTLFIKRDGFEKLKEEIQEKRKLPAISTVKLFHQPGSGGTTMAMQPLCGSCKLDLRHHKSGAGSGPSFYSRRLWSPEHSTAVTK